MGAMEQDRIGRLAEQWREAHPSLDHWPLLVFGRMDRIYALLKGQEAKLAAEYGLNSGEMAVLAALRRSLPDHTRTPSDLADTTFVTSAGTTNRLNSLEKKGLISRRIDADSRRNILVTLTPAGLALADKVIPLNIALKSAVSNALTEQERATMAGLLERMLVALGDVEEEPGSETP